MKIIRVLIYSIFCWSLFGLSSCQSPNPSPLHSTVQPAIATDQEMNAEACQQFLRSALQQPDTPFYYAEWASPNILDSIRNLYKQNEYLPFWFSDQGLLPVAIHYKDSLTAIRSDGLQPEDYNLLRIDLQIQSLRKQKWSLKQAMETELSLSISLFSVMSDILYGRDTLVAPFKYWKLPNDSNIGLLTQFRKAVHEDRILSCIESLRPQHPYYTVFSAEYQRLDRLSTQTQWTKLAAKPDSLYPHGTRSEIRCLRQRLQSEIDAQLDTTDIQWNEALTIALKTYQYRNGIRSTGKLDSTTRSIVNLSIQDRMRIVSLNMDRLRHMPQQFPQPYIWVNVPSMELQYIDHDTTSFSMRVVVGRPSRPTTLLKASLRNIVLSPPWTVPPTIMREEILPGIAKKGSAYLQRKGLRIYDKNRKIVNAASINTHNYTQFRVSQEPGDRSSLGEVKFNMPNPWSIYLHDTPHREDFVKFYRAYSSGCIRVHHPKEFATFLLQDTTRYSYHKIDSICKRRKTIYIPFQRKVDVYTSYLTNAVDSTGHIIFVRDIYHWDQARTVKNNKSTLKPLADSTKVIATETKRQEMLDSINNDNPTDTTGQ